MNSELQKYAKIAGVSYLLVLLVPIIAMLFLDAKLFVAGDMMATVQNIRANEALFRIHSLINLLMFAGVVVLAFALFNIVKRENKLWAGVALGFRFAEAVLGIFAVSISFLTMAFITDKVSINAFSSAQMDSIAGFMVNSYWHITVIIFVLLALGSIPTFYLFLKSKLLPKFIAIWGMVAYALVLVGALISLVYAGEAYMILGSQAIIFETFIGVWLLKKGLLLKE